MNSASKESLLLKCKGAIEELHDEIERLSQVNSLLNNQIFNKDQTIAELECIQPIKRKLLPVEKRPAPQRTGNAVGHRTDLGKSPPESKSAKRKNAVSPRSKLKTAG